MKENTSNFSLVANTSSDQLVVTINYSSSGILEIISFIGLVLNILCLIILVKPGFKEKYRFRYIILKLILDLLVCFMGSGFFDSDCLVICLAQTDLAHLIYLLYIKTYFSLFIYILNGLNELFLINDRIYIFENRGNFLNKRGYFKYIFLFEILFCTVILFPLLFGYTIEKNPFNQNQYYLSVTWFGNTLFYKYYVMFISTIGNFLILCIIIYVSVKSIKAYRDFIERRSISLTAQLHSKSEKKFTIMISIVSALFMIVRILALISNVVDNVNMITKRFLMESLILNLLLEISLYVHSGSNFFILILFNKAFRKSLFCLIK